MSTLSPAKRLMTVEHGLIDLRARTEEQIKALGDKVDAQGKNLDEKLVRVGKDVGDNKKGIEAINRRLDTWPRNPGGNNSRVRLGLYGGGGAVGAVTLIEFLKYLATVF